MTVYSWEKMSDTWLVRSEKMINIYGKYVRRLRYCWNVCMISFLHRLGRKHLPTSGQEERLSRLLDMNTHTHTCIHTHKKLRFAWSTKSTRAQFETSLFLYFEVSVWAQRTDSPPRPAEPDCRTTAMSRLPNLPWTPSAVLQRSEINLA